MKVALVTGGSRGIGADISKTLATGGYKVYVNYNKSKAQAVSLCSELNESGGIAIPIFADVSKESDVINMFSEINKNGDSVSLLVNNAGISHIGLFTELTLEQYNNIFDTNMKSVFLCSKIAALDMINKKSGKIINISSIWGIKGASCEAAYSASKAAVIGFTKAIAAELAPSGITVNAIAPGVIDTDMNKNLSEEDFNILKKEIPLGEIGKPADISSIVLFLASKNADYITGQVINASGGMII